MNSRTGSMWLNKARYLSRPRVVVGNLQARLKELHDRIKGIKAPISNASSPLVSRCARYRKVFLNRIVPWQSIDEESTWETFPYHIDEHDKNLLTEYMAARFKPNTCTSVYGHYARRLDASGGRILLESMPGTEVFRCKLVRLLAKRFQVPLLELQTHDLPPYDRAEDIPDDELTSDDESDDDSDDEYYCDDDSDDSDDDDEDEARASRKAACRRLREGDRVKYVGPPTSIKVHRNRMLSTGQRGEVRQVKRNKLAVIFYTSDEEPPVHWLDAKHIQRDNDTLTHDCYLAMEVLCEVLESHKSIIVYFPDPCCWLSSESSWRTRGEFFHKVKEMFDQLSKRKVLICGQDKSVDGTKDMESDLKELNMGLTTSMSNEEDEMRELFTNVVYVAPLKQKNMFKQFSLQIIEDNKLIAEGRNFTEINKVLKEHDIMCDSLEYVDTKGLILNEREAEKIVGWATNHHLSSCPRPSVKDSRLHVPTKSIELAVLRLKEQKAAILRLKEQKTKAADSAVEAKSKSPKDLANGYEKSFVSAVVSPNEIGVKFDDVGALDDVKKVLQEVVILPLKRPQLFSSGNLLQPCKGLLLFGPPGTGKTLIAKAIATEAGANFINVSPSSLGSKWYGDSELLTKALFTYAQKLAPVIIFLDEVDALLGARGEHNEYDTTRKVKNEFMAAWDGLSSKNSQRILVLGATNRPFDLDEAVIRRMPRRIYVDLPDAGNRLKILKIILAKENLEPGFRFEQLAKDTDGYSGSDLKNLCVAAAYRPVEELLEKENKGDRNDGAPTLRPLQLSDFIHSKAKVGKSVAHDSSSQIELRKWNDEYGQGGSRSKSPFGF